MDSNELNDMKNKYSDVEELASREDPSNRPYDSKYKAIEILEDIIKKLESRTDEHSSALHIHILAKLGALNHEVDELKKSQDVIESALNLCNNFEDKSKVIIPELVCLNQLGILWCSREEYGKAFDYLNNGLELFKRFTENENTNTIYAIEDLFDKKENDFEDRSHSLDLLNTHTCYYLAQVHEKTGKKDKAAEYCHITLRKQLELKVYKPIDWCTNAYTLSYYFLDQDKFETARYHLAASEFILNRYQSEMESKEFSSIEDKEEVMDRIKATFACINREWGRYSYIMLLKSSEKLISEEGLNVENIEDNTSEEFAAEFTTIELDSDYLEVPTNYAVDYEQARNIFLVGQRRLNKAKEYFTLEEHCSDFVEINQDLSIMHKYLANFEHDFDVRLKIHKRRVALLELPLQELNQNVYLLVSRRLMYELAEVNETMMDCKLGKYKGQSEPIPSKDIVKVNGYVQKSIDYFNRYLNSFRDSEGKMPEKFQTENERPILIAYFHLARLWDKFIVTEVSEQKLQNKIKVYAYFKEFVEYCNKFPEAGECVNLELKPAKEMFTLLPIKIESMRRELSYLRENI